MVKQLFIGLLGIGFLSTSLTGCFTLGDPLPTPTPIVASTSTPGPTIRPSSIPTIALTPPPKSSSTPTVTPTPGPTSSGGGGTSPIQHVVVIEQENRTMDDMFNGFPGADTVTVDPVTHMALVSTSLAADCKPSHSHGAFVSEYDNGKMDGWKNESEKGKDCPKVGAPMMFAPATEVAPVYWKLGSTYALANHVLQTNQGPSFPAHQYLMAGQAGGILANGQISTSSPYTFAENGGPGSAIGSGGGNNTYCGAAPGDKVTQINLSSAYPGTENTSGYPCYDVTTIFDLVTNAKLTWHYYGNKKGGFWSGPQSQKHLFNSPNYSYPGTGFFTDIAAGKLSNLTYIMPNAQWSDHPSAHNRLAYYGPSWVGDIVNAIGNSKYWNTTTIIVTWDDWGGFYDHYKPVTSLLSGHTANTYGFRVPVLIIGPYVKQGAIDASDTSQASILKYIETTFGLPSLNTADAWTTDDFTNVFNYSAPARTFNSFTTVEPPSWFEQQKGADTQDVDG